MPAVLDELRQVLAGLTAAGPVELCVALSGGMDSTVLLHALNRLRHEPGGFSLRAVHVNHQLHPDAGRWAEQCTQLCSGLGVGLNIEYVTVATDSGMGPEAAARAVRYGVFEKVQRRGEYLVTAHHQEDQLETVFLHLLRGSGLHGLSGIPTLSGFGQGGLLRPLLRIPRAELEAYAAGNSLSWTDDPSNHDIDLDRNYLRHRVMPMLRARWPAVARTVGRSAQLLTEGAALLDELADIDAQGIVCGETLDLSRLRALEFTRQCNLVRHCLRQLGLPVPTQARLREGLRQLLHARADRQPVLRWPGGQIRRYRDRLYVLQYDPDADAAHDIPEYRWDIRSGLDMGAIRGCLRLETAGSDVDPDWLRNGLRVRFRRGGERIRRSGQAHSKGLKQFLQEQGVVTWMRGHLPLIYAGDQLIAVADLWSLDGPAGSAVCASGRRGFRILWSGHPAIGRRQPNEFAARPAGE